MIFEDECSFRQDGTLHRTWSRKGCQPLIPTTGKRKSVKIFGCVDIIKTRFIYKTSEVFNANTYGAFLEILARHFFKTRMVIKYSISKTMYPIIKIKVYGNGSMKTENLLKFITCLHTAQNSMLQSVCGNMLDAQELIIDILKLMKK